MKSVQLCLAGLVLSSGAVAQTVLFESDFSTGLGWSYNAHAYPAGITDPCVVASGAPVNFGNVARIGDPDCTYESICPDGIGSCLNAGAFWSSVTISIPPNAVNPRLEYDSFLDTEGCSPFDISNVIISEVGGVPPVAIQGDCTPGPWETVTQDLSPWIGKQFQIGFNLSPVDDVNNGGLGWLVDNVRVVADCASYNYCDAAPNSASATGAKIGHTGSLSINQNDFALTLQDGPPGQFAVMFFGPFQTQMPIGQGNLCVWTDADGFRRLLPAVQIDPTGNMGVSVDFTNLSGPSLILAGTQTNFQCWYRDTVGGTSGSNFSDALSVTFCP